MPTLQRPSPMPRRHTPRLLSWAILLALAALIAPEAARAQAVKGTLLGTVTDSTGAAAAGATVTITETRTNITSATATNQSGNYVFSNIQDGVYRIEVTLQGFKKSIREGVEVQVNTTVRADIALAVGELTEAVTVETSTAPLLQTDRADTGRILESKQVSELPLLFGRNFQGLLITVPGATRPSRPHSEFFNPQDSLESKVNGQSRLSNNFQVEGVDNNHKTGLLQVLIPAAESIESVSISTSNFDTSAFAAPPANAFGSLTRNASITGPGYVNFDASLVKRFRFTERIGGELRVDAFNVTNTPHFNNPNTSFGSQTFGQVTSAFGERLAGFGARITF
jgi:hypothetical protein